MKTDVRTTCPYCGVGCGVVARRVKESFEIVGDDLHPANYGRLCSKGAALADTLGLEGRLLYPQLDGRRVPWNEALCRVADGFADVIRRHGPDAVAFYVSGQLLTEDYYVANKLMKGFIGSANIDTNSRLCMASAVAAHKRAFGADLVPGCYEDFEHAELIVLVGSNTAWCHPVLFQRILAAKQRHPQLKLVVIDPRRTPTCAEADLHLPVRSGTDVWLFNGLLVWLESHGLIDRDFVKAHTDGVTRALEAAHASAADPEQVARMCGIDSGRIAKFYDLFASTERVVTAFSQGVNQSTAGTDKINSIINCHLLTGRIGKPGMGPFSLTGQPNAMGGREVGGMSNTLAAHFDLENDQHRILVQHFWNSPRIAARPGLKAVELFEAIHAGRVRAVWIMATNPLVSLPDAGRAREALERCDLVVVSDCTQRTDSTSLAHVLLPAAAWGEKDGLVTNSERCISRQRAFLPLPGEARPDWWIVCEVAKRMGFASAFDYQTPYEIALEHARLASANLHSGRCFDISGLAAVSRGQYNDLEPVQWPLPGATNSGTARLFTDGRFYHPGGRARFVSTEPRRPAHQTDAEFPLVLNTGRIRDQWHSMTRTGRSARLCQHLPEVYADLHAQDALLLGLREGELARLTTRWGSMVARLRVSGEVARGSVFVPIHFSRSNSSDGMVGKLISPAVDALSGEPEFKHTPVRVEPFHVEWHGLVCVRQPLGAPNVSWWSLSREDSFLRYELAGRSRVTDWAEWVRELLGATDATADYLDYSDPAAGRYRAAYLIDEQLMAYACISQRPEFPSGIDVARLFDKRRIGDDERNGLLSARRGAGGTDLGPIVCACFGVRRDAILAATREHGLVDEREIGLRLRAGTNCGSCRPEIRALIEAADVAGEDARQARSFRSSTRTQ
jgi:assimilatory nitrate reductase catalytic subunit